MANSGTLGGGLSDLFIRPVVSYTWANRPAAAGNTDVVIRITDIGGAAGSRWISDGAKWKPEGGRLTLLHSYTDIVSAANTTEQILNMCLVPAGVFKVGDTLRFWNILEKSGTADTTTRRYLVGVLGTTGDAVISYVSHPATNSRAVYELQPYVFTTSTMLRRMSPGGANFNTTSTGPVYEVAVPDISNALYISFSSQMTLGTETSTSKEFMIELISGGV